MSNPIQNIPTSVSEFQAQFGAPPGSQDAQTDCENWQRLCDKLLVERARLRAELEKARLDMFWQEPTLTQTMEEVYAQVDRETPIEQLIAEFETEAEKEA